ncbi:hypothetical protein [Rugosimonospora africana]|uniref:hypothetical protein n=1 Tax=Rugosimonospora africana TaxID=556532 RepID=UPI001941F17F|nr:hypothetical protein [Rugosimonospora africana]
MIHHRLLDVIAAGRARRKARREYAKRFGSQNPFSLAYWSDWRDIHLIGLRAAQALDC